MRNIKTPMKILELEYSDKQIDWNLNKTNFDGLNLLVGISGVGKTKILRAILDMKAIALGQTIPSLKWKMKFQAHSDSVYEWTGETESIQPRLTTNQGLNKINSIFDFGLGANTKIQNEKILENGKVVAERDASTIKFQGSITLKLSPFESLIKLLSLEEKIQPIFNGFSRIIFRDVSRNLVEVRFQETSAINSSDSQYNNLDTIKNSNLGFLLKLLLVSIKHKNEYYKIKGYFSDIFPQVEDIVIREEPNLLNSNIVVMYIKEKGIKNLIHYNDVSSGMMRTIEHLCDIFLSPDNAVVLIDEFENSLGVNCIDTITETILQRREKIQYIITSHHPYIINKVSKDFWKLVTRKGNTVSTHNAKDLNLSESNHEAFLQLLNSEEYLDGIRF